MKWCKYCKAALLTAEEKHWGICLRCGKKLAERRLEPTFVGELGERYRLE